MATVDRTGISSLDLAGYRTYFEEQFRSEFGQDLSLAPETPQGQLIGIMAQSITEESEALIAESNGTSWDHATGRQQDDLGTLTNTSRTGATRSTVTATLTGTVGTVIPRLSRAETLNGDAFLTDATATIGALGTIDVAMTAEDAGPILAAVGALSRIVTLISGWDSITNSAAAVLGATAEGDQAYRDRYYTRVAAWELNSMGAMRTAILTAGATSVEIEENDTTAQVTRQGLNIAANSYMAIVQGGVTLTVAEAIAATKPPGIGTSGAVAQAVADGRTMNFQRVVETAVALTVEITIDTDFPSDGQTDIQDALVAYALANWKTGEGINVSRLYQPILSVIGHVVSTAPAVTLQNGNALPATPDLNVIYVLSAGDVTLNVS